jgi:hypothetical protein
MQKPKSEHTSQCPKIRGKKDSQMLSKFGVKRGNMVLKRGKNVVVRCIPALASVTAGYFRSVVVAASSLGGRCTAWRRGAAMSWSQAGWWAQREVEHGAWCGWLASGARQGRLCVRVLVEKARARRWEGGQPSGWGGAGGVGAGLCAGLVSKVDGVCWAG